jgi:transcriptional regulator with GAF, ATPase, and Fis domain
MGEKGKELQDALQRLEKCCPGSTRVSHMHTASAELHKALLNLDHAKNQEQRLREETDALLEGMKIIITSENIQTAFKLILDVLKKLIKFDNAFVLREQNDGSLSSVASSSPLFENSVWYPGAIFKYILSGNATNTSNISYSTDWQQQPAEIRRNVSSALHIPFNAVTENAILICTSSQEDFFSKSHIQLLERFVPLAAQALCSLKNSELLKNEINKRKRAEESLEEARKELQNAKENR